MEIDDLRKQLQLYVQELEQLRHRLTEVSNTAVYQQRISQLEFQLQEHRRDLDIYSQASQEKEAIIVRLNAQLLVNYYTKIDF